MKWITAILFLGLSLVGCAVKGGRCYPVVGFGWVIVQTNHPTVTAVKTTVLGAGASTLPPSLLVGFGRTTCIYAATNSEVILQIK